MKVAKIFSLSGLLFMTGVIIYILYAGSFAQEVKLLMTLPWGRATLIDLYIGFFIICLWILYRERSNFRAVVWIVSVMLLGNWASCLYIAIALYNSQGDWNTFFHGNV